MRTIAGIGVAERFRTPCLPAWAAGPPRPFRMHESTLGNWDLASANWRICPTLFESSQPVDDGHLEPLDQDPGSTPQKASPGLRPQTGGLLEYPLSVRLAQSAGHRGGGQPITRRGHQRRLRPVSVAQAPSQELLSTQAAVQPEMGRRPLLPRTGPSWRTLGQDSRQLEFRSGILNARVMFSTRGLEPSPGDVVLDVAVDRGPAPGVVRVLSWVNLVRTWVPAKA